MTILNTEAELKIKELEDYKFTVEEMLSNAESKEDTLNQEVTLAIIDTKVYLWKRLIKDGLDITISAVTYEILGQVRGIVISNNKERLILQTHATWLRKVKVKKFMLTATNEAVYLNGFDARLSNSEIDRLY